MIKSGDEQQISKVLITLAAQSKQIIKSIIELIYFMRGSLSYEEAMAMSPFERIEVSEFVNKRLEQEGKKSFPVY